MRKFLVAAGLLAVVACGEKKPTADAGMAGQTTTLADSTHKADSTKRADSIAKADSQTKADSMAKAMPAPTKKP
jgi:hypothetical protein